MNLTLMFTSMPPQSLMLQLSASAVYIILLNNPLLSACCVVLVNFKSLFASLLSILCHHPLVIHQN